LEAFVNLLYLLIGLLFLTVGRKLFWLFVGLLGFLLAFNWADQNVTSDPAWLAFVIALIIGVLGSFLATFLQRLAAGLAGFVAGGWILLSILRLINWPVGDFSWIPFVLGGIIGGVLALVLFDCALIVLSSFAGASLIVEALDFTRIMEIGLFLFLILVGIAIQGSTFYQRPQPASSPPPASTPE
jgi:hypothetical protein